MERFVAFLLEYYAGNLPVWLSPEQVRIIPVADQFLDYGREVESALQSKGIRANIDSRNEKMGYKIREAQLQKIPYMLIVGGKEAQNRTVSVRERAKGDQGAVPIEAFVDQVLQQIENYT